LKKKRNFERNNFEKKRKIKENKKRGKVSKKNKGKKS